MAGDRLEIDLHGPLLDDLMKSQDMYADILAIGNLIVTGLRGRIPKDTTALADTARASMHHSNIYRDKRWECEVQYGNAQHDYANIIEDRDHPLGETLRALGYGDVSL